MKSLLVICIFLAGVGAEAASVAFSGGTAKPENVEPLSLLNVQKTVLNGAVKAERLTLKFGDKNGAPLVVPGFFHIAVDDGGRRLTLDLAQVQQTSVDKSDLRAMLKQSELIRDAEITMDPVDKSTNITFLMKRPVVAKATAKGHLVIEIQEAK